MPISDALTSSVSQSSVQDSSAAEQVSQSDARVDGEQVSHYSNNTVEQWQPSSIDASQVGDAAKSFGPVLGSIGQMLFSGAGLDKGAVRDASMSALGGLLGGASGGGDGVDFGAILKFAATAIPALLQCQDPISLVETGLKLASDPNFPKVVEAVFTGCTKVAELAGEALA